MENNNPQNAQDVVPSLDNFMGGGEESTQGTVFDNLENLDNGTPEGGEQPPAGSPAEDGTTPPEGDTGTPPDTGGSDTIADQDDLVTLLSTDESLLSADDREFKVSIYDKFGANGVDFKGNLLNANGEVVLSADDFNNYIDTGALPLDKDGNQVNAKGEILVDAADIVETVNVVDLTRTLIESELGYEFANEDGSKKSYPNTAEGNAQFAKDAIVAAQTSAVQSFLAVNPEIKDMFFHLQAGGTLEDFSQGRVDYTTVDVKSLSKEQKMEYIKQSYQKQGIQNVNPIMDLLESVSDDKITQSAADAILSLKEISDQESKINEEKYAAQQVEDQLNADKYWKEVKSVIDKGNLGNLQIRNEDRNDFYKYIAEPINANGDTREMIDAQKETAENQLMISYLRYKGGDVSKLIETRAKLNRADALRERMGKSVPIPRVSNSKERKSSSRGDAYVPSLDILG